MPGLNDDFPIEDNTDENLEEIYKAIDTPIEVNEDASITAGEEIEQVSSLESYLNGLRYVLESIKNSGGINQQLATEANAVLPGFINDTRPINSFTKTVSSTQLKASLESITAAIYAGIVAAIAALAAIIYKFIKWIRGNNGDGADLWFEEEASISDDGIKNIQQEVETLAKTNKEIAKVTLGTLEDLNVPGRALEKLAEGVDPIIAEVLYQGKTFKHIEAICKHFAGWPRSFDETSKKLDEIVARLVLSDGKLNYSDATVHNYIKEYNTAVANKDYKRLHGLLGSTMSIVEGGRELSITEVKDMLVKEIEEVNSREKVKIPSIMQVLTLAKEFKRVEVARNINIAFGETNTTPLNDIQKRISDISQKINTASKNAGKHSGDNSGPTQEAEDLCKTFFKNVVKELSTNFNAYCDITARIIKIMQGATQHTDKLITAVLKDYIAAAEVIVGMGKDEPAENDNSNDTNAADNKPEVFVNRETISSIKKLKVLLSNWVSKKK